MLASSMLFDPVGLQSPCLTCQSHCAALRKTSQQCGWRTALLPQQTSLRVLTDPAAGTRRSRARAVPSRGASTSTFSGYGCGERTTPHKTGWGEGGKISHVVIPLSLRVITYSACVWVRVSVCECVCVSLWRTCRRAAHFREEFVAFPYVCRMQPLSVS